jgi:hypothetical protein
LIGTDIKMTNGNGAVLLRFKGVNQIETPLP